MEGHWRWHYAKPEQYGKLSVLEERLKAWRKRLNSASLIDSLGTLQEEVPGSDVVVVATPVLSFDATIQIIAQSHYHDSIVTDVGSVKKHIVESAERHFSTNYSGFIGAHPIAGAEHSGVSAAFAELFDRKRTILTPTDRSGDEAVETVRNMWITAGSVVSDMDVNLHDDLVAASSHLPHLIAFGLVHYIANHQRNRECFELAASGFYDFTRIASSDATMWHDISMANSEAIARELEGYINELSVILRSVTNRDGAILEEILTTAKSTRDRNLAQWQDIGVTKLKSNLDQFQNSSRHAAGRPNLGSR